MELHKLAKLLKEARYRAGEKKGLTWKISGKPRQLRQEIASQEIGISFRKYCEIEGMERGFADDYALGRTIAFINKYLGTDYKGGKP